ncbi:MAG: 5'-nucleotidase C-terminal domain-containing protein [Bacteroidales bacterium]
MHRKILNSFFVLFLLGTMSCSDLHNTQRTAVLESSEQVEINEDLVAEDPEMIAFITPYKQRMDSIMNEVIGYSNEDMGSKTPDSKLPQFVLEVIQKQAEKATGEKVDLAMVNLGGLRSPIYKGPVTVGNIYSTFPFENALTIVTIKGRAIRDLYKLVDDRKRLAVTRIDNIDDKKEYRLATIDYLVDGNDNASMLGSSFNREDTGIMLRDLIIDYYRSNNK